jgi:hypothetical protein
MRGEVNCEGFGDDLWKLGLLRYSTRGATVPAGTVHVEKAERGRLGLEGRRERRSTPDITPPLFEQLVLKLQHGHLDNDSTPHKPMT